MGICVGNITKLLTILQINSLFNFFSSRELCCVCWFVEIFMVYGIDPKLFTGLIYRMVKPRIMLLILQSSFSKQWNDFCYYFGHKLDALLIQKFVGQWIQQDMCKQTQRQFCGILIGYLLYLKSILCGMGSFMKYYLLKVLNIIFIPPKIIVLKTKVINGYFNLYY